MHITISLTKSDVAFLERFIHMMKTYSFEDTYFKTNDRKFLEDNQYFIQDFQKNQIFEWHPDGCGFVKFIFTEIGKAFMQQYNAEVGNQITLSNIFRPSPRDLRFEII